MLYKEFIAETAQELMATNIYDDDDLMDLTKERTNGTSERVKQLAKGCIAAAKVLADALEEDYKNEPVDGGFKRCAEKETFFDNYVNWSKTV